MRYHIFGHPKNLEHVLVTRRMVNRDIYLDACFPRKTYVSFRVINGAYDLYEIPGTTDCFIPSGGFDYREGVNIRVQHLGTIDTHYLDDYNEIIDQFKMQMAGGDYQI